ncbi:MAG: hypothetical protein JJT88_20875 [Gammaproteobacteria bacterium]|nr:hypothetical protein [Gammaproteobacteria bacterium]
MSPFLSILEQALHFAVNQRRQLAKAAGPPAVLVFGLMLIPTTEAVLMPVFMVAGLGANAWLAVATHRVALLGDTESFRWGRREWRFVGVSLLLVAGWIGVTLVLSLPILGLAMLLPSSLAGFFNLVLVGVFVFSAYQLAQVSIILPATAVEQSLGIRQAHALTAGRRGTAFATIVLIPVFIALPVIAMTATQLPVLPAVLELLGIIFWILSLSFLYRFVVEEVARGPAAPSGQDDATPPEARL